MEKKGGKIPLKEVTLIDCSARLADPLLASVVTLITATTSLAKMLVVALPCRNAAARPSPSGSEGSSRLGRPGPFLLLVLVVSGSNLHFLYQI